MVKNDRLRQFIVVISAVLGIAGAFIGSGALGGTPIQGAAGGALSTDATPIAPAVPAFGIWTPIYIGLVAYAVWQFLPKQKSSPRQRVLGYPIAASLLLNAAWILEVQYGPLPLSVPVIVLLLVVLVVVFLRLLATRPSGLVESIIVDGTMGLYLGWVCVATAANTAAVLADAGFRGFGWGQDAWGVIVIAVAGIVGILLALRGRGRFTPSAALCWGLVWVAVARVSGDLRSIPTAVAAILAVVVIVAVTVIARVRAKELA